MSRYFENLLIHDIMNCLLVTVGVGSYVED